MLFVSVAAVTTVSIAPCCAASDEQFPYTAYANSEDVYVRSGPGKNYYPTEKLGKGTPVEIYRHDPGGWYAIRPPQGSFSWVPADALKPQGDHIAVVQRDHTLCFVGTRFSNTHDVHQVRLDKGEKVEILDIKQVGDGDAAQSWCQIAPPSGEFRWVFGKFVDRDLPEGISRREMTNMRFVRRMHLKSATARPRCTPRIRRIGRLRVKFRRRPRAIRSPPENRAGAIAANGAAQALPAIKRGHPPPIHSNRIWTQSICRFPRSLPTNR